MMKRKLTRMLAFALVMLLAVGLLPVGFADQEVRIRDTAYSETLGLRAAMTGPVSDTAAFGVTGGCLAMMFLSRKTVYPWMICMFSMLLPLLILLTNIFPA